MIRRRSTKLLIGFFFLVGTCGVLATPAVPPVLSIVHVDNTNFQFILQAWPGDYVIESSTDPEGIWSGTTNVSVGNGGTLSLAIPSQGHDRMYIRARGLTPLDGAGCIAQFQTLGNLFEPEVTCNSPLLFNWIWSDGTTSSDRPLASKDFGTPGSRTQGLVVNPAASVTSINLGFDGSDGGNSTPLNNRPPQNVASVHFPYPLTNLLYWASSYNPITNTLSFTGFTALEAAECFHCTNLEHVVVADLPALRRVCFENCRLSELDLSGDPNLEDVRAALNAYTNIAVGRGTGPKIWHWCTRDNPQLPARFQDVVTNFPALQELLIWNDSQTGKVQFAATANITDLEAAYNDYSLADVHGLADLGWCDLHQNRLTNFLVTGCTSLEYLAVNNNNLTTAALDKILADLDSGSPSLIALDISQNPHRPSKTGYAHYTNLVARGVSVALDWPPAGAGTNNFAGGTNAITFVTISRVSHMEIRTAAGTTPAISWHFGDGTTLSGSKIVSHDFGTTGVFTNFVKVVPTDSVTYFGAQEGYVQQGIKAVYGAKNFRNLSFLYLYDEGFSDLSITGCKQLLQLHFSGNYVPVAACDQWFIDLNNAVAGPVTGADFYYSANRRTSRSDAAWTSLVNKGYTMHPE
jgi:hypothetical protein